MSQYHYIIYVKDENDSTLYPNHIQAKSIQEAIEILCASDNTRKMYIVTNEFNMHDKERFIFVDIGAFGKESGYLRIDGMIIRIDDDTNLRTCPSEFGDYKILCKDSVQNCNACWQQIFER
ncbi:hypothetical protein AALA22_15335 [Anaerovoracaceae bacterium 41-7]